MKIQELMSRNPAHCGPDDTLNVSAQLMWERDCGAVPVVDRERVVGMITDRDACMAAYTRGQQLSQIRVRDVMGEQLVSCREDDSLESVQALMSEHQVRRIPVLNDRGALRGIVSLNDLAIAAQRGGTSPSRRGVAETLSAICQHRPEAMHVRAAE